VIRGEACDILIIDASMIKLEDCDALIRIAYKALLEHYKHEEDSSGVKLITRANRHVLEVCMACGENLVP
jgi:hypothetical protein